MKIREFLSPGITIHNDLNPLLWDKDHLKPEVKKKLYLIAQHFKKFVDVDFPVVDIIITGGQTGKYYTSQSDLDLHLITDYRQIDCDQELEELFDTKRMLYKKRYDIQIKGIEVELYVEDINQPAIGGAYSIINDKWIKPSTSPKQNIDQTDITKHAEKLSSLIQHSLSSNDLETLERVKNFISLYRRQGLSKDGEYGVANLAFKSIRNSGLIDQLRNKIKDLESEKLSLRQ